MICDDIIVSVMEAIPFLLIAAPLRYILSSLTHSILLVFML